MNLGTGIVEDSSRELNQYSGECKLKIERNRGRTIKEGLNPENIKFDCDKDTLKRGFGWAECDITFA